MRLVVEGLSVPCGDVECASKLGLQFGVKSDYTNVTHWTVTCINCGAKTSVPVEKVEIVLGGAK